jgi:alpha-mannosidase
MTPGRWLENLPITSGTIFAYVMNNYWSTNYKAGQDGRFTFRFSITSDEHINPSDASRFGESVVSPMQAIRMPENSEGADLPHSGSFLEIRPDNIMLTTLKPAEDGRGYIIRIRETNGRKTRARVLLHDSAVLKATQCDLVERDRHILHVGDDGVLEIDVAPHAMSTIRIQ